MAKNIAPNITITCPDNCSHPTPRVRARGYGGACKTCPKRKTEQRAKWTGSLTYVALWVPKFFPFTEIFFHVGFIEMAPYTYIWNSISFFLKIKKKPQLSLHTFRNLTTCLHNTYLYFGSFSQNVNAIISSITTFQIWRPDVGEPGLTTDRYSYICFWFSILNTTQEILLHFKAVKFAKVKLLDSLHFH